MEFLGPSASTCPELRAVQSLHAVQKDGSSSFHKSKIGSIEETDSGHQIEGEAGTDTVAPDGGFNLELNVRGSD
jgi:hypothetical protein